MKKILSLFALTGLLISCQSSSTKDQAQSNSEAQDSTGQATTYQKSTVDWAHNATIYEVNIRQYTPEGTIKAFEQHLDRLQDLGVKILWIMPIQPIGQKNRKGEEGSYYSIANYHEVNPQFGSMADFKRLVEEAHARDMKVILDWVANHTAFDHPWTEEHPEWYTKDSLGEIIPPVADWSDVADLNYDQKGLWRAMRKEMKFWLKEANIDGFRCDVAMMVPMEFWNETRQALDSIKPVFMLAEAEGPDFHKKAFDMTYGWEAHHIFNEIAKGEMDLHHLTEYLAKEDSLYLAEDLRMNFITNHDENSWNGTVYERMGENAKNFYVLCTGLKRSMPLIYSGQEAALSKRLAFFKRDPISWTDTSLYSFYRQMTTLKAKHPALRNGKDESSLEILETQSDQLLAFRRASGEESLVFCLNFSDEAVSINMADYWNTESQPKNYMTAGAIDLENSQEIPAHSFLIATNP